MEQSIHYKVGQSLLHLGACITKKALYYKVEQVLQIGARTIKVGQVIYYKMSQSLLPSGVGIVKWGNFITKWGRYYKVEQLRTVHGRDTRANGDPCYLTGQMRFES